MSYCRLDAAADDAAADGAAADDAAADDAAGDDAAGVACDNCLNAQLAVYESIILREQMILLNKTLSLKKLC